MHRTDDADNVGNLFDGGDPGVPRLPTQLSPAFMNAVQEELVNVVLASGIGLVKGTWTQVRDALKSGFPFSKIYAALASGGANSAAVKGENLTANVAASVFGAFFDAANANGGGDSTGVYARGMFGAYLRSYIAGGAGAILEAYNYAAAANVAAIVRGVVDWSGQYAVAKTASPGANVVCVEQIAKAWGRITTDGAGGYTIDDAINVASCSFPGANVLRVTFAQAFANANFVAIARANGRYVDVGENTAYVDLTAYNETTDVVINPATTGLTFKLAVFGRQ